MQLPWTQHCHAKCDDATAACASKHAMQYNSALHCIALKLQTHRLRWCAEPGTGGQAQRASKEEGVQAGAAGPGLGAPPRG